LAGSENARSSKVVIVILEGLAYRYTSLAQPQMDTTPFLRQMASSGVEFASMRSTVTHTTKAIFAMLTGRFPSASQDVVEAIPNPRRFASLATILAGQAGYRAAFFQSAKGTFEARPSLVANLGFDLFMAREQLVDPSRYLGYLAADEFAMLPAIRNWVSAEQRPFLLVVMCSATHDPYEVPTWYGQRASDPVDRYIQTIRYTDSFIEALHGQLKELGLDQETIFCVVGDHGEAFGEHGRLGHDMIGFDEALHVPWLITGPIGVRPGTRILLPTSSIDVCPTILGMLGFATDGFDGADCLADLRKDRPVYFSCWANEGPAGFVIDNKKYVYDGVCDQVLAYDLATDPLERSACVLSDQQADAIKIQVLAWRRSTILKVPYQVDRKAMVFDEWVCRPVARDCTCKYRPQG
jgi:phosphoglycerol transferase MdoB-like AlkP superfamily enzyme